MIKVGGRFLLWGMKIQVFEFNGRDISFKELGDDIPMAMPIAAFKQEATAI